MFSLKTNWKMDTRYCILLVCVLLNINNAQGFAKRDVIQTPSPNILESVPQTINRFRECLDQSLAAVVSQVNEKQLQPAFNALGDQLNRFSKAVTCQCLTVITPDSIILQRGPLRQRMHFDPYGCFVRELVSDDTVSDGSAANLYDALTSPNGTT